MTNCKLQGVLLEVPRCPFSETFSETPSETPGPPRTSQACCPYSCCPFKLFRPPSSGIGGESRGSSCQGCWEFPKLVVSNLWKATKEYLNQRGTKIRVFRECFRAPFLALFFPHFPSLFPLQAVFTFLPFLPS